MLDDPRIKPQIDEMGATIEAMARGINRRLRLPLEEAGQLVRNALWRILEMTKESGEDPLVILHKVRDNTLENKWRDLLHTILTREFSRLFEDHRYYIDINTKTGVGKRRRVPKTKSFEEWEKPANGNEPFDVRPYLSEIIERLPVAEREIVYRIMYEEENVKEFQGARKLSRRGMAKLSAITLDHMKIEIQNKEKELFMGSSMKGMANPSPPK